MQKILNIIFIALFVALGTFIFLPGAAANFKGEAAENMATPGSLYLKNCARCHGADGKSQTKLGKSLDAPDLTTEKRSIKRTITVITKGSDGMPAFGQKLKKNDIIALANYVRSL